MFNTTSYEVKEFDIISDDACLEVLKDANKPGFCGDNYKHFETLCNTDLWMYDIIQFKYVPTSHGNITVTLYRHWPNPKKVFESSSKEDNFILQEDGGYRIRIQSVTQSVLSGTFTYVITKTCKSVKNFMEDWLQSNHFNPRHVNILFTGNRIVPITYGHKEYIVTNLVKVPGILLLMKRINNNIMDATDEIVWTYLAEALGGHIRKEGNFKYCN